MAHLQPASQEAERIGPGLTLTVALWTVLFGVLLCVLAGLMLIARWHTLSPAHTVQAPARPEPEVSNVRTELFGGPAAGEQLKEDQRHALRGYGWVQREQGLVRIPIDVAMDLEVQAQQGQQGGPR